MATKAMPRGINEQLRSSKQERHIYEGKGGHGPFAKSLRFSLVFIPKRRSWGHGFLNFPQRRGQGHLVCPAFEGDAHGLIEAGNGIEKGDFGA